MSDRPNTMTVGELRERLAGYDDSDELFFGSGDLSFYRVKDRNSGRPRLVQIEFNEVYQVDSPNR